MDGQTGPYALPANSTMHSIGMHSIGMHSIGMHSIRMRSIGERGLKGGFA